MQISSLRWLWQVGVAAALLFATGCARSLRPIPSPNSTPLPIASVTTITAQVPAPMFSTPTATPVNKVAFGIDVNIHDNNIGPANVNRVLQLMHQAGATYVRIGGGWGEAEPAPGQYDWRVFDRVIQLAHANQLNVLLEVGGDTPTWDLPPNADTHGGLVDYAPADCTGADAQHETDCRAFGEYIDALVRHVAPLGVQYLIVRNEPQNFPKNWIGGTADEFAQFIAVAHAAAHAADPNIKILNGGTEILPDALAQIIAKYSAHLALVKQSYAFTQSLYSNPKWCDNLDVLDVHLGDHGPIYSPQIVDLSEQALQKCNGGKFVPVWATEIGYSSFTQVQQLPELMAELGDRYTNGDAAQSQYLAETYAALARDSNLSGVNWTFLVDPPYSGDPRQDGAGLGLLDENYNAKPSFATFQRVVRGTGG